jgi:hypothetical protein
MMVKFRKTFSVVKSFPRESKGQDRYVISCLHIWTHRGLSWENCVGNCTDHAPLMFGSIRGFTTLGRKKKKSRHHNTCFIHREVPVSKTLGDKMKKFFG